jgi:(2R)-sulfolactate sulfo-lyase subunit alpha
MAMCRRRLVHSGRTASVQPPHRIAPTPRIFPPQSSPANDGRRFCELGTLHIDCTGAIMIHFVVHDEGDSVGVVVVEGIKSGQPLTGWIMDQDKEIQVQAQNDIPIGHKLAIKALADKDTVIKYGVDIGRTIAPIKVGEHAHVHNIKTKRW